jgi:AhpD family alkylhydroperoxidase
MSRITIPETAAAPEGSQATLGAINGKLGRVPNFFRVLSNSPAVINAHAALNQGLGKALDLKTRERIALAVAAVNGCEYCDAAHTFTGYTFAKLSKEEVALARQGTSADPHAAAVTGFARKVAEVGARFRQKTSRPSARLASAKSDRGDRGGCRGKLLHQPDQQCCWHGSGFPSI